MTKPKRKRSKTICFRMSENEYAHLQDKLKESGLTQQSFFLNVIDSSVISSADEVAEIRKTNTEYADTNQQLQGIATNINQMAHSQNLLISLLQDKNPENSNISVEEVISSLPSLSSLALISQQIDDIRKELNIEWRSQRRLASRLKVTADSET